MDDMHPRKRRVIFSILYSTCPTVFYRRPAECAADCSISIWTGGGIYFETLRKSCLLGSRRGTPSVQNPIGPHCKWHTFVLDAKTGSILKADRVKLAATFSSGTNPRQSQCFLVTVGAKGARSNIAITGEKIGKAEWNHKIGNIQTAQVVEHMSIYIDLSRVKLY